MRDPMSDEEFARLPDNALLRIDEIVTTAQHRGGWPLGRARLFTAIEDGIFPRGRIIGRDRLFTAAEVRAGIAKLVEICDALEAAASASEAEVRAA